MHISTDRVQRLSWAIRSNLSLTMVLQLTRTCNNRLCKQLSPSDLARLLTLLANADEVCHGGVQIGQYCLMSLLRSEIELAWLISEATVCTPSRTSQTYQLLKVEGPKVPIVPTCTLLLRRPHSKSPMMDWRRHNANELRTTDAARRSRRAHSRRRGAESSSANAV